MQYPWWAFLADFSDEENQKEPTWPAFSRGYILFELVKNFVASRTGFLPLKIQGILRW